MRRKDGKGKDGRRKGRKSTDGKSMDRKSMDRKSSDKESMGRKSTDKESMGRISPDKKRGDKKGTDAGRGRLGPKLYTALGILCVGALLGTAMVFPRYYSILYDKNTLNQVSFTDVNISTYEASYDSFVGKLYAFARAFSGQKKALRAVQTNELELGMDRTELTKITNKEFQKLYKNGVLDGELKVKEKKLVLCERYTIYETKEKDGMKGISCWKLAYEDTKRKVTVYLDEEYHKVYAMEVSYGLIYDEVSKQTVVHASSGSMTGDVDRIEYFSKYWDGILRYYDIYSYPGLVSDGYMKGSGTGEVLFEGKYEMQIQKSYSIDEEGWSKCSIGLPMKKMIQF